MTSTDSHASLIAAVPHWGWMAIGWDARNKFQPLWGKRESSKPCPQNVWQPTVKDRSLVPFLTLRNAKCMCWHAPNEVFSTWWDFPGFLKQLVNIHRVNELNWEEDPSVPVKFPNTYQVPPQPLIWSSLEPMAHESYKDDGFYCFKTPIWNIICYSVNKYFKQETHMKKDGCNVG